MEHLKNISEKLDFDLGPEYDNFENTVNEICKIVDGLASTDKDIQKKAIRKADLYLYEKNNEDVNEDNLETKSTKSVFNPIVIEEDEANRKGQMSQRMFMKMTEKDAKKRASSRKERYQEANYNKERGNKLFKEKKYEEALLHYNKALEKVKDSGILWTNRALTLIELGLYEKALHDCEWALRANHNSLRGLLYRAKAYWLMGNKKLAKESLQEARDKFPERFDEIDDFQQSFIKNA